MSSQAMQRMGTPHFDKRFAEVPRAAESLYQRHRRFHRARRQPIDHVPFQPQAVTSAELERIAQLTRSGDAQQGKELRGLLEMLVAARFAQKHVRTVGDWIAALQLGLSLLGVRPGLSVALSSYTDFSHVVALWRLGAIPVFVDIDEATLQMDADALRSRLRAATTAPIRCVLVHHVGGSPAGVAGVAAVAREHGASVLEAVWGTYPPRHRNRPAGSFGNVLCINSAAEPAGDRGRVAFVATDDDALAEKLDGWLQRCDGEVWPPAARTFGAHFDPQSLVPDTLASMRALVQVEKDEARHHRRQEIAATYNAAFSGFAELTPPGEQASDVPAWNLYPLRLNCNRLPVSRKAFRAALEARGVQTAIHYLPAHTHPALQIATGETDPCPLAQRAYQREVSLPVHEQMSDEHAAFVVRAVVDVVCRATLKSETLDVR